ncbi:UbiD family decarboxylase [Dehalobacter restrictus]|uniref:UbiD family decarboxylase n=1 Tax=Dehalobacter restrictus TaxID=55583 RepID=A0A857DJ56_9FIRM|nr:UbiD family decarboxylase [Dehalobacter restrictus]QHA00987.1 UbiD family decarboxylase [Dehalobacter restrictus]
MSQDLRDFLKQLERDGEVKHVTEEVKRAYEISTLVMELEKEHRYPVMVFDKVENSAFPVVTSILSTRERFGKGLGVEASKVSETYAERIKKRIEEVKVINNPPFAEHCITGDDIDLYKLPIPTHFPIDAGPYVTSGLCVAKDPVSGVETLGFHRMQLKNKNTLGISLHSRQRLWEYFRRSEEKGESLEAAIVIGVHPNIALGSMALVPYDQGKYGAIAGLFGEPLEVAPCTTVNLQVPAYAEIVLEGEILADVREQEGPFAEFTNYACYRSTENVFKVKAIRYRQNAFYHDLTPGMSSEHITVVAIQREGDVLNALHQTLPNIKAVHAPFSACGLFHCYISIKKIAEGQPMQAIYAAFAVDHNIKMVIVVDEDVDVFNEEEVLWALATRLQADKGVSILPQHLGMGVTLDPSTDELSRTSKMGIDATKPLSGFAPKIEMNDDVKKAVQRLLKYAR